MKKSATIHDIAREANTSSATVSRVLSNSGYPVSKKLQQIILKTAKQLNYSPNALGRQLKTNSSMTIGVIIPSISNPFYSSVVLGIEEVARKKGYQVLLCNSLRSPKLEKEYFRTLHEKQIKGIIVSSISLDLGFLKGLTDLGKILVSLDQTLHYTDGSQLKFDYLKGGYMATEYLISMGHRQIAFVTSPLDRPSRKGIFEGYYKAMKEHSLELKEHYIQIASSEEEQSELNYEFVIGKLLAGNLLSMPNKPTGIFCCNDMIAIGVMHEVNERGFKVPDDISIIGFDNIDFSQMVTPALTTIEQPDYELGRKACELLMDRLTGKEGSNTNLMLEPKFIKRNSVMMLTK